MKLIFKIFSIFIIIFTIFVVYLSIFGIETDRFNNQISNKIKDIDNQIEVELKKIKLVLDPFKLKLNIKTVGSKLKNKDETIEIANIKTQLSLRSLIKNEFLIENLEISTKSLEIKSLISFLRSIQNTPQLFVLEKTFDRGFLIADIKLEFDPQGRIKDNYEINGYIKDTRLSIFKKYNLQKLNLIFEYKKDNLFLEDLAFSLNNLDLFSKNVSVKKIQNYYLIKGKIEHKNIDIAEQNLSLFIKPFLPNIDIEKLKLSSNNNFSFKLTKKFKINDLELDSNVLIDKLLITNKLNLKNFFPNMKESLSLSKHKLKIKYNNKNFHIEGRGNALLQKNNDILIYSVNKKKDNLNFKTSLKIDNNPLKVNFLNYKKNASSIQLEGSINQTNEIFIKSLSLEEKKNKIITKNLFLNNQYEIIKFDEIILDYIDKENKKNQVRIYSDKRQYIINGSSFNANKIIDDLLFTNNRSNFLNINTNVQINIDKIFLDDDNNLSNFNGNISFKNKEISEADLNGNFSENKKLKFTINTKDNNKITTLYIDKAEPIVNRYKFIKGFDEGILDFYSVKKSKESFSQLKIYEFKLKELPVLTKILTLASLQGIADILSGEGIRFDEFEMSFENKGNFMKINEIYAIGPAISILMEGYVEQDKLISLRGTLVPATTINKFIGSLPVLGKILVGSKTGEGVFGVSFKIKGPPKNLETSVNPIKTLTPRFITRTLEKIKKN